MVREQAFDVSEMAVVTHLMAKSAGKPMVLLPDVVLAPFQHAYALYNSRHGTLTPADLNGKRVGIRSFTTTTGAWLRGILANDYGVDLTSIDWVTFEEAHVAEFSDTTKRARAGKQIVQMLIDGELDAVLGQQSGHPDLKPLFFAAAAEAKAWFARHARPARTSTRSSRPSSSTSTSPAATASRSPMPVPVSSWRRTGNRSCGPRKSARRARRGD
jgi:4,5-dihydroxyphthalate decarboxylase